MGDNNHNNIPNNDDENDDKKNNSHRSSSSNNTIIDSKNNESIVMMTDNPCWGSPFNCCLERLLSIIDRNACILYEDPQYIVLHKPPDLRMDGPYPATVHKLLTY